MRFRMMQESEPNAEWRQLAGKIASLKGAAAGIARRVASIVRRPVGSESQLEIDIRAWLDDQDMVQLMSNLLDTNRKILAVFTAGQDYYNYSGQLADGLAKGCEVENLREIYFDQSDHTYSRIAHRKLLVREIVSWVEQQFSDR